MVGPITAIHAKSVGARGLEDAANSDVAACLSSSRGSSQGTGTLVLDGTSLSFAFTVPGESNTLLSGATLVSENHRSVARLNAELNARLVQELANTHTTFERLEDQLQLSNVLPPMRGVEIIAKTAIGSGVVVWVMHISQVMAALLAASTAWTQIDPLSVLLASRDLASTPTDDAAEEMFDSDLSQRILQGKHDTPAIIAPHQSVTKPVRQDRSCK